MDWWVQNSSSAELICWIFSSALSLALRWVKRGVKVEGDWVEWVRGDGKGVDADVADVLGFFIIGEGAVGFEGVALPFCVLEGVFGVDADEASLALRFVFAIGLKPILFFLFTNGTLKVGDEVEPFALAKVDVAAFAFLGVGAWFLVFLLSPCLPSGESGSSSEGAKSDSSSSSLLKSISIFLFLVDEVDVRDVTDAHP